MTQQRLVQEVPGLVDGTASRSADKALPVASSLHSPAWLVGFVLLEIGCQVALLFPSIAGARAVVRTTAFAGSVVLTFLLRGSQKWHPAGSAALCALGVLALSIVHPDSGVTVGAATTILNLAILGPIFWVPQIRVDDQAVRRVFLLVWTFQALSALIGALQVYFPGSFQPALASVIEESKLDVLQITLANGERVLRPMGLTDTPGGAGIGATYCVLFATALLLDRPKPLFRALLIVSMAVGCFTLYLCQVRSLLIVLFVSVLTMGTAYSSRRGFGRTAKLALAIAVPGLVGLFFAVLIGGDSVTDRLASLIESDPGTVYYTNRGLFLQHTFVDLLPEYPLGAGLGRWGTMSSYFGDPSRPVIWAEIQWSGWLLDGGVPLMVLYAVALFVAVREGVRALSPRDTAGEALHVWASVLIGYSVGMVAFTFNAVPFAGTFGVDFWLLNATLFAARQQRDRWLPEPPSSTLRVTPSRWSRSRSTA